MVVHGLLQTAEGIASPCLAVLEKPVQIFERKGGKRIGDNRSASERARPPFHRALEPGNQASALERLNGSGDPIGLRRPTICELAIVENGLDFLCCIGGPEERSYALPNSSAHVQRS